MYMCFLSKGENIVAGPAPAEANPFRRAVFVVPILRAWLPLPIVCKTSPETQCMIQDYEL